MGNILDLIKKKIIRKDRGEALPADYGTVVSLQELVLEQRRSGQLLKNESNKMSTAGAGSYRSIFKGRGMEFDEVRVYQHGDDIRMIDWRVTARRGEAYTKLFQEERERPVYIVADLRARMRFATKGEFKSAISARIAALLAWSAYGRGDKVGGIVMTDAKNKNFAPQKNRKRIFSFLQALSDATYERGTKTEAGIAEALDRIHRVSKSGGMVFVVSDFNDFDDEAKKRFADASLKNEVFFINLIDPIEEDLAPGKYQVSNGEAFLTLHADDKSFMRAYREHFAKKRENLKAYCISKKIKLITMETDDDIPDTLRRGIMRKLNAG